MPLPPLQTVGDVRRLLGIPTRKHLGLYLWAAGRTPPRTRWPGYDPADPAYRVTVHRVSRDGRVKGRVKTPTRCAYRVRVIPKASGGVRLLAVPVAPLKQAQRALLREVLDKVPTHPAAHGFVRGRSTATNAAPHAGAAVVMKFDVTDFFPTVTFRRLAGMFKAMGYPAGTFRVSTDDAAPCVAPVLARLCCYQPWDKPWASAHLSQGAPTSPAAANLVCRRLDSRLSGMAARLGGNYTRYADDLTVSFPTTTHPPPHLVAKWVGDVLRTEGFTPNAKKFRVFRRGDRQQVTGLVVNAAPPGAPAARVPREVRRRLRAALHDARKNGVALAARGDPHFLPKLAGYAAYVNATDPARGRALIDSVAALRPAPENDKRVEPDTRI